MQTTAIAPGPAEGFDIGGSEESLARLQDYFGRFGDIYRVFAPSRGVFNYVINHPDDVKRVLLTNHRNYTKGEGIDRVKILLGNGIMTSEGAFWRRQRRMMQPAFHRRVIDQFSLLLNEANEKYAERWAAMAARGEAVNVSSDTSEMTLEIVLKSIFGTDLDKLAQQMGVNPFEVVAKQSNRDLKFAFQFRSLGRLVGELIQQRRHAPEEHFDFLSMFMLTRDRESDEPMSDKELIDEVLTLIVAGHETTAAALTWTWYLVSRHPEAAEQLRAEADQTSAQGVLGLGAAEAMSFTHQVLQESHRCFHQPLHAASASALLERCRRIQARALRRRRCQRAPQIRLYSLCRGAAPLHRREYRHVRNAGAHAHHDAAFSPHPRHRRTH
jgi:cytochrome P450